MRYITKYLLFTLCLVSSLVINATTPQEALDIVANFNYYMSVWSRNPGDIEARDGLKAICNGGYGMRVADQLALEQCTTTNDNTILLESYLQIFNSRKREKVKYQIKNVQIKKITNERTKNDPNIHTVVADVEITSLSLNYNIKDVFYIKEGKIFFIGDYYNEIEIILEVPPYILFSSNGGRKNIPIRSNVEWTAYHTPNEWTEIKISGDKINIHVLNNNSRDGKSDVIRVVAGKNEKKINIFQEGIYIAIKEAFIAGASRKGDKKTSFDSSNLNGKYHGIILKLLYEKITTPQSIHIYFKCSNYEGTNQIIQLPAYSQEKELLISPPFKFPQGKYSLEIESTEGQKIFTKSFQISY